MVLLNRDANGKILEIPATITQVEELLAWCAYLLRDLHPTDRILETDLSNEYVMTTGTFRTPLHGDRLLIRGTLKLRDDYASAGLKSWLDIEPLSNTPIPAAYKS